MIPEVFMQVWCRRSCFQLSTLFLAAEDQLIFLDHISFFLRISPMLATDAENAWLYHEELAYTKATVKEQECRGSVCQITPDHFHAHIGIIALRSAPCPLSSEWDLAPKKWRLWHHTWCWPSRRQHMTTKFAGDENWLIIGFLMEGIEILCSFSFTLHTCHKSGLFGDEETNSESEERSGGQESCKNNLPHGWILSQSACS